MIIKLNGTNLDYTLEAEKNVGEVLGNIEAVCRKEHETIIKVQVDGKELTTEELDHLFLQPTHLNITIDLSTVSGKDIRRYMHELTQELLTYTDELERISVYMQTGKDGQVLTILETFSQKINELHRSFLLSDITGIPTDILIADKPLQDYQKEITALLQDIVSSIEEKDIIQVGDLAEYELAPLVKSLINGLLSILI